ncbi:MAG: glycosyltransferase [Solirubrobacteraceae bacterium]
MALPPVSVVIPTYNDKDVLPATLAPLLADEATGEVVIVVDGSTDGSYELLQSMAEQDDRLRPFFIENRGRTGAGQYALEHVSHDIVLMLDADVVGAPGLVSGHARVHAEGERPRLVMGYMPTPVPPPGPGSFVYERYAEQYELACAAWERDPRNVFTRHWAGNVSLPRQILIDAGGYDAGAPIKYMDDLEMGLRLARTELEPVFDRRLLAEHRLERTVAGYVSTSRKYGQAIVMIDQLHPGQVHTPGWLTAKSGRDAAIRRFTSRPQGYALTSRLTMAALELGARLKLWTLQRRAAAVIDRLETLQGVIEQSRLAAS